MGAAKNNSVSEGAKDHKYSLFNTGGLLRRTEKMEAILMKAASFIAVIILGYGLRKAGFFKEEDFYVLSKIVLKITLPASIIANFSQAEIQPAMLLLCLVGFAGGVLYMSLGWILGGKDISYPEYVRLQYWKFHHAIYRRFFWSYRCSHHQFI